MPHIANECLELLKCENITEWPEIKVKNSQIFLNIAVQINGKTRDVTTVENNLDEKQLTKHILKKSKANKYLINKKINKTIFIRNKIINYIILNK